MQLKMAPGELAYWQPFGQAADHGAKSKAPKGRKQVSQPVDADDLRRRLYSVISQREIAKEKKRIARVAEAARIAEDAAKRLAPSGTYEPETTQYEAMITDLSEPRSNGAREPTTESVPKRFSPSMVNTTQHQIPLPGTNEPYVPREAAAQFARTATAHGLRDMSRIHNLSLGALRTHTESLPVIAAKTAGQGLALRKVQSERERLRERNQFQTTRALEDTAVIDVARNLKQRHSVPNNDSYHDWTTSHRRYSARKLLQSDERETIRAVKPDDTIPEGEVVAAGRPINPSDYNRADWTQSDELQDTRRGTKSPLVKKTDSLWGLRDRFGKTAQDKDTTLDLTERVDAIVPKPMKKGFWTKIKRQVAAVHV